MPAALVVPVSGPYVGTFSALPIGTNHDDGYEMAATLQGQEIRETDAYGMTLVEAIYRGQNWRIRLRGLEWKSGLLAILQGFGAQQPLAQGLLGPYLANIGDRWSKFSSTLLLTAILANPPTVPLSLTALLASFAPNTTSAFLMTSKMRELPLEMVLLPYSAVVGSLTLNVPFTVT
jgi:hypothetical protein